MSTQLLIYNEALLICGESQLNSQTGLTENVPGREYLDHVWANGGVKHCLESAQWNFAMRSAKFDYDTAVEPPFGHKRAFEIPSDWCATSAMCQDEFFHEPLTLYEDEAGFWYCDLDIIYVRYVSDDSTYGGNLSKWPQRFADYVAAHFASKIILKLTSDEKKRDGVLKYEEQQHKKAKSHDAMGSPTRFPAVGAWNGSRRGHGSGRDRGNRHNLIG